MATPGSTGEINLVTKASPKVMERFKQRSVTDDLFSNEYSWSGVATVRIPSVDVVPLHDYDQERTDGGSRFGPLTNLGDRWQEHTVRDRKSFSFVIDETYNTQQMQIKKASKDLKREVDEVVIPYVDQYRIRKMAAAASAAKHNLATATISKSNIVETIMGANAAMSERLIGQGGRICYISHKNVINYNLAQQIVGASTYGGSVGKGSLGERAILKGEIGEIDGCRIRKVPSGYLPPDVELMIVKKGINFAPNQLRSFRINPGAHVVEGKIVTGLIQHDCFVPEGREASIFVVTTQGSVDLDIVGSGVLSLADGTLDISGSGQAFTGTLSKAGGAKTVEVVTTNSDSIDTANVMSVVSADPAKVTAKFDPETKLITLKANATSGSVAVTVTANGKTGFTTPKNVVLTVTCDT